MTDLVRGHCNNPNLTLTVNWPCAAEGIGGAITYPSIDQRQVPGGGASHSRLVRIRAQAFKVGQVAHPCLRFGQTNEERARGGREKDHLRPGQSPAGRRPSPAVDRSVPSLLLKYFKSR